MKITLEFDHPGDTEALHHALKGESYYLTLFEIHETCIRRINSNGPEYTGEGLARAILDEIKERLPEFNML